MPPLSRSAIPVSDILIQKLSYTTTSTSSPQPDACGAVRILADDGTVQVGLGAGRPGAAANCLTMS